MGRTTFAVHDHFVAVTESVQQFFAHCSPIEFFPFGAARQALLQPSVMHDPVPNQEIKVVPSVVFCLHTLLLFNKISNYTFSIGMNADRIVPNFEINSRYLFPYNMSIMKSTELPTLPSANKKKWADWLARQHDKSTGVWLQIAKKDAGIPSVTYEEALDVALCYGWIDGQKKGFDDKYWLQKFTPRTAKSIWSKINTEKAERLIASGEMKPAGLQAIEAAKQDGRWDAAYASQKNISVPEDFQTTLDKNIIAKKFFATLNSVNRYAILFRIHNAKKPEMRARKIQQFIEMLERNEKIYP